MRTGPSGATACGQPCSCGQTVAGAAARESLPQGRAKRPFSFPRRAVDTALAGTIHHGFSGAHRLLPSMGPETQERVSENHEHPKGPRQKPPSFPQPRLGCHSFHHLLLVTLGQPGSSVGEQHAVSSQDGGTHGDWLAGGGGHRGLPSPRGPRQGTEVSLPGQPWRCPSGSPGKQKQNGSGSPGDQLSSSFSAIPLGKSPSLTVSAPTTHPKCSLLGRPGEGVPSEEGTPPRLGSPQISSSDPTSTASHHCWHCCCFSWRLDNGAWGCGRRWRRRFQVGLRSQEAAEATCD